VKFAAAKRRLRRRQARRCVIPAAGRSSASPIAIDRRRTVAAAGHERPAFVAGIHRITHPRPFDELGIPPDVTRDRLRYRVRERNTAMYVIREVVHCKPGKVREMIEKFRAISSALTELGHEPLRLLTDVSGGPFWTIVAETQVDAVEQFFDMEQKVMADERLRKGMVGYHDLIESGRREIYRVEA
jgi:hypothetical protein